MPKLKHYVVLGALLCVGLGAPGFSAHWAWVEQPMPALPWDGDSGIVYLLHDKSDETLTAILEDRYTGIIKVWKFASQQWIEVWEGVPDMGGSSYQYFTSYASYYDDNLGTIVLFASAVAGFDQSCFILLKFIPDVGFVNILSCLPILFMDYYNWPPVSISFDLSRHRAVFVGGFLAVVDGAYGYVTPEFDGTKLYILPSVLDPPESYASFSNGSSGYDPCSSRVVYYGLRGDNPVLETWEYDGHQWMQIPTAPGPPSFPSPILGVVYSEELGGLLALPNDMGPIDTWIYQNRQWRKANIANQFAGRLYGYLGYATGGRRLVFYGGYDDNGELSNQMWSLECDKHCKPLAKPSQ